jgi:two-component system, OmpR family, response regulator
VPKAKKRPTIVVCDDDERLRELMKVTLGPSYDYADAGDADTAIELCRTRRPCLLLLDVMLPGRSGLDVLRTIRADAKLSDTPVIVISAWQAAEDRVAAEFAGADAFLTKPFELSDLIETAERLLEHGR